MIVVEFVLLGFVFAVLSCVMVAVLCVLLLGVPVWLRLWVVGCCVWCLWFGWFSICCWWLVSDFALLVIVL